MTSIKNYADVKGLVTTTWKSQVRVLRYGLNVFAESVGLDSFKSVDDIQDKTVKKQQVREVGLTM